MLICVKLVTLMSVRFASRLFVGLSIANTLAMRVSPCNPREVGWTKSSGTMDVPGAAIPADASPGFRAMS